MKARILLAISFSALALVGCRKDFEKVRKVNFDVSLPVTTVKVGEKVNFQMTGDPDIITFYSGEEGNAYLYKDTDRIIETQMSLSFVTTTKSGTPGLANPSRVPVFWSDDFTGEYTEEAIANATWNEITDNFQMPDDTPIANMFSEELLISPLYEDPEKPIYFMFHYVVEQYNGSDNGRTQWAFSKVSFKGISGETSGELYDIPGAGWQMVYDKESFDSAAEGSTPAYPKVDASKLTFSSSFVPLHDVEAWAVSGPIYKKDNINNGPDRGKGIKAIADADMERYSYTWNEPGDYTVTFVAANANAYDRKEAVKEIKIKVVEDEGSITPPQPGDWN